MSRGKVRDKPLIPPTALVVDDQSQDSATLAICFQQPNDKLKLPAIVHHYQLKRMACGHFCSYPTAGDGRCCLCADTVRCLIRVEGLKK